MRRKVPMPADFAEHIDDTVADLMVRYGYGKTTIHKWIAEARNHGAERYCRVNRKIPDDFLDHVHESLVKQARRHHASIDTIRSWIERTGATRHPAKSGTVPKKPPENLAEMRKTMTVAEIARAGGNGIGTVNRWLKEVGISAPTKRNGSVPTPRPADFEQVQAGKVIMHLVDHYGVSRNIIQRWLGEIGIKRSAGFAKGGAGNVAAKTLARRPMVSTFTQTAPVDRAYKEDSRAGAAARYLQPDYIPTYRCRADGTQDINGKFWRCGRRVAITDAEIIALADEVRARNERRLAA